MLLCSFGSMLQFGSQPVPMGISMPVRTLADNGFHCLITVYRQLQEKHGLQNNRKIPDWGQDIFSEMCVIMRPTSQDELLRFMLYCNDLHRVYLQVAYEWPTLSR